MTPMAIESLSAGEAGLIALSGFATVFIMLAVLCLICVVMAKAMGTKKTAPAAAPAAQAPADQTYGGDIKLIDVDEKTAACIMAIVSDQTGIPLSELIFKKIRGL